MDNADKVRCPWPLSNEIMIKYHDEEWGVSVHDDSKHFEFLILETFQAGLSWLTVLKKRDNFRKAFAGFNPVKVAAFGIKEITRLMQDAGIIRNKMKIEAAVVNAKAFIEVQKEFGRFDAYIWGFVKNKPVKNKWKSIKDLPARTGLSDRISADMKKRGFKFTGSTTMYAHLQAAGLVNDHLANCFRYKACCNSD